MIKKTVLAALAAAFCAACAEAQEMKKPPKRLSPQAQEDIDRLEKAAGYPPHLKGADMSEYRKMLREHDPQYASRCVEGPPPPPGIPQNKLQTALFGKTPQQAETGIEVVASRIEMCMRRKGARQLAEDCLANKGGRCRNPRAAQQQLDTLEKNCANYDQNEAEAEKGDKEFLAALKNRLEWRDYCACCGNAGSRCTRQGQDTCEKMRN